MRTTSVGLAAVAAWTLIPLALSAPAAVADTEATPHHVSAPGQAAKPLARGVTKKHLCSAPAPGKAACDAIRLENSSGVNVDPSGRAVRPNVAHPSDATNAPDGLSPSDVRRAYRVRARSGHQRVVAIVDAFGYPNAESDLATYRKQYGLRSCTRGNGCLSIQSQTGSTTSLPAYDEGWAGETALDLDAVSAICPDCRIALVQAKSSDTSDLAAAEQTAAKIPGVVAISNSYGSDDAADAADGNAYDHPGIAITASTGDDGYQGPSFPASSHYVTAVGGTSLSWDTRHHWWNESAWSGSGSGCTTLNPAPVGQTSAMTGCSGRAEADVSAVADPSTGLASYGPDGWAVVGGTSLSSPLIAGMYALAGKPVGYGNTLPYARPNRFFDITEGTNGSCAAWCTAGDGWDGPTGVGTPDGVSGL